jgi:uncharacterized protein YndB with AHSA1/START domain
MRAILLATALAAAAPVPAEACRQPVSASARVEADGTHTLVHEVLVHAPHDQVWHAISTAEGWRSWATPVAWAPQPDVIETSYAPGAQPGDPSTIRQQILRRVPRRLMAFRTVKAPQGFPNFDTYAKVTSLFELEAAGPRATRVRLTSTGYADSEAGRALLGFFKKGNRASLETLRDRFRDGPRDWSAGR